MQTLANFLRTQNEESNFFDEDQMNLLENLIRDAPQNELCESLDMELIANELGVGGLLNDVQSNLVIEYVNEQLDEDLRDYREDIVDSNKNIIGGFFTPDLMFQLNEKINQHDVLKVLDVIENI